MAAKKKPATSFWQHAKLENTFLTMMEMSRVKEIIKKKINNNKLKEGQIIQN